MQPADAPAIAGVPPRNGPEIIFGIAKKRFIKNIFVLVEREKKTEKGYFPIFQNQNSRISVIRLELFFIKKFLKMI